jgi:hypothetical protein
VSRLAPLYPDMATLMHLGVARIETKVGANQAVRSTIVPGGNPVLSQSATDAVLRWKIEAASAPPTNILQITFEAG